MSNPASPYRLYPLGDQALTIEWEPVIRPSLHREIMARWNQLRSLPLPGCMEWTPAYHTLTLFYEPSVIKSRCGPHQTAFGWICEQLQPLLEQPLETDTYTARRMEIPVCYAEEFGTDLYHLAAEKNLRPDELIRLHTERTYLVYMLGFLPGFAYMGELPPALVTPRKARPVPVTAGSVGIAGLQTGIYPLDAPGGWHVIGKTPWSLFDPRREEPCLLRPGDEVRFVAISREEYHNYYAYL